MPRLIPSIPLARPGDRDDFVRTTSTDASNQSTRLRWADLGQIYRHGTHKTSYSHTCERTPLCGIVSKDAVGSNAKPFPCYQRRKTHPARNMPRLTAPVCIEVPTVTKIHIICIKRMRPSLSPVKVCNNAPTASPAICSCVSEVLRQDECPHIDSDDGAGQAL